MSTFSRIEEKNSLLITGALVALTLVGGLIVSAAITPTNASATTVSTREGNLFDGGDHQEFSFDGEDGGIIRDNLSIGEEAEDFYFTASNKGNVSGLPGLRVSDFDESAIPAGTLDNTHLIVTMMGNNNAENKARVTLREFISNTFVMGEVAHNGNAVMAPGQVLKLGVRVLPPTSAEGYTAEDFRDFQVEFAMEFVFSAVDNSYQSDLGRYAVAKGELRDGTAFGNMFLIPNDDAVRASTGELKAEA